MKKRVDPASGAKARPVAPVPRARASSTRRTEGIRTEGRAARVVADVLRGTAEQLGRVGFAALRIDDVAALSGVNKTTIYRRWPTRADLVSATLRSLKSTTPADTGSLRGDVHAWVRQHDTFARSTLGAGIVRMIQTERAHPELEPIARSLREEQRAARHAIVLRAVARGELPRCVDAKLVSELLFAPLAARLFIFGDPITPREVDVVVDLVALGARAIENREAERGGSRKRPASA